jgi:mRNA interferase YafQ
MARPVFTTATFRRDYKRAGRNPHWRLSELQSVIRKLADGAALAPKHRDHKLSGEFDDCRECHVRPDWLLIYRIDDDGLHLIRTGSHADLFG